MTMNTTNSTVYITSAPKERRGMMTIIKIDDSIFSIDLADITIEEFNDLVKTHPTLQIVKFIHY